MKNDTPKIQTMWWTVESLPPKGVAYLGRGCFRSWHLPLRAGCSGTTWESKGPEIVIHFTSAPGIDPGKTSLIYRGVTAGTVSKVHLDKGLGTVVVTVSVKKFAAELATEGTDFWIEQPVITLHEISGLESIIREIPFTPVAMAKDKMATVLRPALDEAPLSALNSEVLRVTLNSDRNSFIGRGTPVFHRGINVGKVREKNFNAEGRPEIEVTIFEQYADIDPNPTPDFRSHLQRR